MKDDCKKRRACHAINVGKKSTRQEDKGISRKEYCPVSPVETHIKSIALLFGDQNGMMSDERVVSL